MVNVNEGASIFIAIFSQQGNISFQNNFPPPPKKKIIEIEAVRKDKNRETHSHGKILRVGRFFSNGSSITFTEFARSKFSSRSQR